MMSAVSRSSSSRAPRRLALRRAVLPERHTGATLGDAKNTTNMLDTGAPARRAQ
jgi:hypothetical protein